MQLDPAAVTERMRVKLGETRPPAESLDDLPDPVVGHTTLLPVAAAAAVTHHKHGVSASVCPPGAGADYPEESARRQSARLVRGRRRGGQTSDLETGNHARQLPAMEVARMPVGVRPLALHAACGDRANQGLPRHADRARRVGRAIPRLGAGAPDGQSESAPDAAEAIGKLGLQTSSHQGMEPPRREAVQLVQHSAHRAQEPRVGELVETPGTRDEVRHVTARADHGARARLRLVVTEGSGIASLHAPSVPEPTRGVEVRMSRGFSSSCPMKFCAQLLAHGAVWWGRPEVILNRRCDVRAGETGREIGPFEAQDAADVVSELDGIVPCRGTLAFMAVTPDRVERTQVVVEPRDGVPRDGGPAGWPAPRTPAGPTPLIEKISSVGADQVSERRVDGVEIK